jgi:hypothetical protein
MQYWKQPSSSSESLAEYVAMALMCPLQHASRMEEFDPPTGTAQEGSVVGGWGIVVKGWQDIVVVVVFLVLEIDAVRVCCSVSVCGLV